MDDVSVISKVLYRHVNNTLGSEADVRTRRMVMDLEHDVKNVVHNFNPRLEKQHLSGSTAEGLRFKSSAIDTMLIVRGVRVIFSLRQLSHYTSTTVLVAECEGVRPGFALLRLVTDKHVPEIIHSYFRLGNRYYIATVLWRNQFLCRYELYIAHGPCTSGKIGNTEFDNAYCIKSDIWPDAALGCVSRLRKAGWPSHDVLRAIVKKGCLFVVIGSRDSLHEGYEWRISFSLAEKTLIHNMTHCQFLTYGLLKIFLKEAIDVNSEIKGLLCSYFMKTIVLWKVTQHDGWSESNFLQNFWKCFQALILYVISGYCPNFFIPENNMFRGKVEGRTKRKLLSHLLSLHAVGYGCLFQCPSFHGVFQEIYLHKVDSLMLRGDKDSFEKSKMDIKLTLEIWNLHFYMHQEGRINLAVVLRMESHLSHLPDMASFVIKTWMKILLCQICANRSKQMVQNSSLSNKEHYKEKRLISGFPRSLAYDVGSHLIYLSLILYHFCTFCDFPAVIEILKQVKRRLRHRQLMYVWNLHVPKYRNAGGETTSISTMMKKIVAFPPVFNHETYIPELRLEHEASRIFSAEGILIPPLVCANFLLYLCLLKEHDFGQANAVLDELSTLIHTDNGYHIHETDRSVSWQILGICQEMNSDYQGAYYSYTTAMKQKWYQFRSVSEMRIRSVLSYLASSKNYSLNN